MYFIGAEGIGLCRTEHQFFSLDRIKIFQKMILSNNSKDRRECLMQILPLQEIDFLGLFRVMSGRQVTIRLLDPPIHEFLPKPAAPDFKEQVTELANTTGITYEACIRRIFELQETNPMMGCRGCRLGIIYPEITEMQVKAVIRK